MNIQWKPANRKWRDILVLAAVVLLFRIFYVELINYFKSDYQYNLADLIKTIFSEYPIILLVVISDFYVILYISKVYSWGKDTLLKILLFFLAFAVISSASTFLFCLPELKKYTWSELVASKQLEATFMVSAMLNIVVMGVSDIFLYYRKSHKKELDAEIHKKNKARFQYEQLKNQLNPHFLFNSLNVLDYLVHTDPDKASSFIKKLAGVYRYLLSKESEMMVKLEEEIEFTTMYAELMKERFDTGMEIQIDIDEQFMKSYVIPCSIQLLVENALKHNIVSSESPLVIKIYTKDFFIIVENNCQPKISDEKSNKLGLKNIEGQYKSLFNKSIEVKKSNDKFIVRLPLVIN
jgi:two-component system, LytTR family, sensor kinase